MVKPMSILGNIYKASSDSPKKEIIETFLKMDNFRLERIISSGQRTPDGEWYDQSEDEWVVMLTGAAQLSFEDSNEVITLQPGDYLNIPAHRRHRVEQTAPSEPTIWLAIHYDAKMTS